MIPHRVMNLGSNILGLDREQHIRMDGWTARMGTGGLHSVKHISTPGVWISIYP
jgi:hypothetical protein